MAVEVAIGKHVVRHAAIERHALERPAGGVLLARIDDHDGVVEHFRHGGEVMRELPGADQHQAPARSVHAGEHFAVELDEVARGAGRERCLAGRHVQAPADQLLPADGGEQLGKPALGGDRLEHHLQRAAAGQAPAGGFLVGDAVGDQLRALAREGLRAHLLDQVVLDATAGDRSHDLTIVANDDHGPHRTRRRAPGLDDRTERRAPARRTPRLGAFQNFHVNAVHRRLVWRMVPKG